MSDFNIQFEEQDQSITLEFEQIGGGAVKSVNGKTGAVVLDAGDLEYDDTETYSSGSVGDALSDLKEDLDDTDSALFRVYRDNALISTPSKWTIGQGVWPKDGTNYVDSKCCRTGYIPIENPTLIVMTDNTYNFNVWEYSLQSVLSATYSPKPNYDDKSTIILPKNSSAYFRIGVSRKDSADITSADTTALGSAIKTYIITDQTLSLTGVPADAKSTYDELVKKIGFEKVLLSSDDMNGYGENGVYCYTASNLPLNAPDPDSNGVVLVCHGYDRVGFASQIVTTNNGKLYIRNQYANGTWTSWAQVGGAGSGTIQNTYNITTSPTITTDTNGWLQAVDTDTSDETGKTDMTGAIMSMLTDTGYCHLGEGIFYVSGNIDLPEGSVLCGCGKKTVVRLLQSTTSGYCVKIDKFCTIKDISFEGAKTLALPDTKGTRNGIAFAADYDASPSVTTDHCMVANVWLKNFSGAGIYCHNTSINYAKGVYVLNAFIYNCFVGIDIDYYSEFNKFTNVCTAWCKFGCINNGGNNVFTACTFHATNTGFYIDGTQPNSAHGTINGCTFCHIGSNAGKAIDIRNTANGFIIDSCQIWYNSVNIENSSGIVISNCEFGRGTTGAGATVNISGGNAVIFNGCMFMNDVNYAPDITITNNTKVKFNNCYGSVSGNAITA